MQKSILEISRMNGKKGEKNQQQFNSMIHLFDVIQWVYLSSEKITSVHSIRMNGLKIKVGNDLIMNYYRHHLMKS